MSVVRLSRGMRQPTEHSCSRRTRCIPMPSRPAGASAPPSTRMVGSEGGRERCKRSGLRRIRRRPSRGRCGTHLRAAREGQAQGHPVRDVCSRAVSAAWARAQARERRSRTRSRARPWTLVVQLTVTEGNARAQSLYESCGLSALRRRAMRGEGRGSLRLQGSHVVPTSARAARGCGSLIHRSNAYFDGCPSQVRACPPGEREGVRPSGWRSGSSRASPDRARERSTADRGLHRKTLSRRAGRARRADGRLSGDARPEPAAAEPSMRIAQVSPLYESVPPK